MVDGYALAMIGAAISVGAAALGAGMAIASNGSAMAGSLTERPEVFSKTMIAVVLAEALAIYGLLISIMILGSATPGMATSEGFIALSAGLAMCLGAIGAGIGIAYAGAAMTAAVTESPAVGAKSMLAVVLAEALAIYALLIAIMMIGQLGG